MIAPAARMMLFGPCPRPNVRKLRFLMADYSLFAELAQILGTEGYEWRVIQDEARV